MEVRIFGNVSATPTHDVIGFDLGNGMAALATLALTNTKTNPSASAASAQLLAGNASRVGARIVNNGTTNLHIQDSSKPTETIVPPGGTYQSGDGYQGAIMGYWEGSPTGTASVSEVAF